jgi:2-iminobutanoate/2-iminopropanoate deaminase
MNTLADDSIPRSGTYSRVGSHSPARSAGPFVFTSGVGPVDPETRAVIGTTVAEQTGVVLERIAAILAQHDLRLRDVIKATVHLQHLDRDFAAFDAAYRARMDDPMPARTTVGSTLNGILVEIDVVAFSRRHRFADLPPVSGGER